MLFLWVNPAGRWCLGVGALVGFASAGVGKLIGPYVGLGSEGYVLGMAAGPLAIILTDFFIRLSVFPDPDFGGLGAFFWPSRGGKVSGFHAAFFGLFWLPLGCWLVWMTYHRLADDERKQVQAAAAKKEDERLQRITQRISRDGAVVTLEDLKGTYKVTLTNKTGKDLAKVTIWPRFSYTSTSAAPKPVEWASWKQDESKSFTSPGNMPLTVFWFDLYAYPAGADAPRFVIVNSMELKNGKWVQNEKGH
jgi:hypothetical protein